MQSNFSAFTNDNQFCLSMNEWNQFSNYGEFEGLISIQNSLYQTILNVEQRDGELIYILDGRIMKKQLNQKLKPIQNKFYICSGLANQMVSRNKISGMLYGREKDYIQEAITIKMDKKQEYGQNYGRIIGMKQMSIIMESITIEENKESGRQLTWIEYWVKDMMMKMNVKQVCGWNYIRISIINAKSEKKVFIITAKKLEDGIQDLGHIKVILKILKVVTMIFYQKNKVYGLKFLITLQIIVNESWLVHMKIIVEMFIGISHMKIRRIKNIYLKEEKIIIAMKQNKENGQKYLSILIQKPKFLLKENMIQYGKKILIIIKNIEVQQFITKIELNLVNGSNQIKILTLIVKFFIKELMNMELKLEIDKLNLAFQQLIINIQIAGGKYNNQGLQQGKQKEYTIIFMSNKQYKNMQFQIIKINGEGKYDENGLIQGQWTILHYKFEQQLYNLFTFGGKLGYDSWTNQGWNQTQIFGIFSRNEISQENQNIGEGKYNVDSLMNGNWTDLDDTYTGFMSKQFVGKYKNGKKVGRYQTSKDIYSYELIRGGEYDKNEIKIGKWTELNEIFIQGQEIKIHAGFYQNDEKEGFWDIMKRDHDRQQFKKIGQDNLNKKLFFFVQNLIFLIIQVTIMKYQQKNKQKCNHYQHLLFIIIPKRKIW